MFNDYSFAASHEDLAIVFGMFSAVFLITMLAAAVLLIVAQWKLFKKSGEPGWKVLIPIYGIYVQYKLYWKPRWFVVTILLSLLAGIASGVVAAGASPAIGAISSIAAIAGGIIGIFFSINLARSFGQGGAFAVGLIFLAVIFIPILAFGKYEYIGPGGQPRDEAIL